MGESEIFLFYLFEYENRIISYPYSNSDGEWVAWTKKHMWGDVDGRMGQWGLCLAT